MTSCNNVREHCKGSLSSRHQEGVPPAADRVGLGRQEEAVCDITLCPPKPCRDPSPPHALQQAPADVTRGSVPGARPLLGPGCPLLLRATRDASPQSLPVPTWAESLVLPVLSALFSVAESGSVTIRRTAACPSSTSSRKLTSQRSRRRESSGCLSPGHTGFYLRSVDDGANPSPEPVGAAPGLVLRKLACMAPLLRPRSAPRLRAPPCTEHACVRGCPSVQTQVSHEWRRRGPAVREGPRPSSPSVSPPGGQAARLGSRQLAAVRPEPPGSVPGAARLSRQSAVCGAGSRPAGEPGLGFCLARVPWTVAELGSPSSALGMTVSLGAGDRGDPCRLPT